MGLSDVVLCRLPSCRFWMALMFLYALGLSSFQAFWIDCSFVPLPFEVFATRFDLAFLPSGAVLADVCRLVVRVLDV